MKKCGVYCAVSNDTKKEEIENYDVDHVINSVIEQLDELIEGADVGHAFDIDKNYKLIVKAAANHLIEKL